MSFLRRIRSSLFSLYSKRQLTRFPSTANNPNEQTPTTDGIFMSIARYGKKNPTLEIGSHNPPLSYKSIPIVDLANQPIPSPKVANIVKQLNTQMKNGFENPDQTKEKMVFDIPDGDSYLRLPVPDVVDVNELEVSRNGSCVFVKKRGKDFITFHHVGYGICDVGGVTCELEKGVLMIYIKGKYSDKLGEIKVDDS